MGSKNSVLKNNKTNSNKNEKKTIRTFLRKINRISRKTISKKPFVRENKKVRENVGYFSKSSVELQDNSINSVHLIKNSKIPKDNRKVCENLNFETLYKDETTNYSKGRFKRQRGSRDNATNKNHGQITKPSRRNYQNVFTNGDDTETTDSLLSSCDSDLSDEDLDATDQYNINDELCFLIGENFNTYQHPVTECLTLTLSEEIVNYMEKNQQFVFADEGRLSKKNVVESWVENTNTKRVKRYDFLDKACSTNPVSDNIRPNNLNVAFVKGLIYRKEIYGPSINQAGQAGPSQLQVPVNTGQYNLPCHNKPCGCKCLQPWDNDFGMCLPPLTNHTPIINPPLKKSENSRTSMQLKKQDVPKDKRNSSQKINKKKLPVRKALATTVISKKGKAKKRTSTGNPKPLTSQKGKKRTSSPTPKPLTSQKGKKRTSSPTAKPLTSRKAKKRTPSATPKPLTSQKTSSAKPLGSPVKRSSKKVKKPVTRGRSQVSMLPSESDEDLPSIIENREESNSNDDNIVEKKKSLIVKSKSRASSKENLTKNKKNTGKLVKLDGNTIKKKSRRSRSNKSSPMENKDDELPFAFKSTSKRKLKRDVTIDNDSNGSSQPSKNGGPSNIRIGVSRPDDSGYDIMFRDKGDMKVKVEQVISGKNRVFTYNSGYEAFGSAGKDTEEKPSEEEVKTPNLEPSENFKRKSLEDTKNLTKKPATFKVKIPRTLDKQTKNLKGKSAENAVMKSSSFLPKTSVESFLFHSRPPAVAFTNSPSEYSSSPASQFPSKVESSLEDPNYTAEVHTDKCTMEGNKIECLTSIPHVKVVFNIPGANEKKIETVKPVIAPSQNDIHVDVGLNPIGPKFLQQINQQGVKYDSLIPNENLYGRTDPQNMHRKVEHGDEQHKTRSKITDNVQPPASISIVDLHAHSEQNEPNKSISNVYDSNILSEIKERLSQMKLELRNECPCLASHFQDKSENGDKHGKTDRMIIIRTKRREGSEDCSDDSDSSQEKENMDFLQRLSNSMMKNEPKFKDNKTNEYEQNKEEKITYQEPKLQEKSVLGSKKNVGEKDTFHRKSKIIDSTELSRGLEDELLSHPELCDTNNLMNLSEEEESSFLNRVRRKKSREAIRSILEHPESRVTEEEALMTKSRRKTVDNTQFHKTQQRNINFKTASSPDKLDTKNEEEQPKVLKTSPTGISHQDINGNKYDIPSPANEMNIDEIEISEPGELNEIIDRKEGNDPSKEQTFRQDKNFLSKKGIETQNRPEMDHSNSSVPNVNSLMNVKELTESSLNDDGLVNQAFVSAYSNSIDERSTIQPKSPNGYFNEGQNLLKENIFEEDLPFQNYKEINKENMSEHDTKDKFHSKNEKRYNNGEEPSLQDKDVYQTTNIESSDLPKRNRLGSDGHPERDTLDNSLTHQELFDRTSDQNDVLYSNGNSVGRMKSIREASVWQHPESTITEYDALLSKTKGSLDKKIQKKNELNGNGRVGLTKMNNSSPEIDRLNKVNNGKGGLDRKLKPYYEPQKNVESNEKLSNRSFSGNNAQPIRYTNQKTNNETHSSKKQNAEANGRPKIFHLNTMTKTDRPLTKNIGEYAFEREAYNRSNLTESRQVASNSADKSESMFSTGKSPIPVMSSSQVLYDKQGIVKGGVANEDSPSKMNEVDTNAKKTYEHGAKKNLPKKEGSYKSLKPSSVRDKSDSPTERKKENGTPDKIFSPGIAMRCCCGTVCPQACDNSKQRRFSSSHS